ncbi:hypothetical protein NVP1181O_66 [Vibrio phage 1.181.O._10N.286.46.C9]|nr:hypothetical protein NVP1181O_66 [Vibrio phage 1.181.O._10N.286.46.C9]
MKIPNDIDIYGDNSYRGKCKKEDLEVVDFVSWLKENYRDYHRLLIHPKNEGKKSAQQRNWDEKMGAFNVGASDQIIPCLLPFVVEVKRENHAECSITNKQLDYLRTAKRNGAFTGIALGSKGLKLAFLEWKSQQDRIMNVWLTMQE